MAFPTDTGVLASAGDGRRFAGPFVSAAGNAYVIGRPSGANTTIRARKATDPSSSWSTAGDWSVSTGGAPSVYGFAASQVGDNIIVVTHADGTTAVNVFSMATDSWGTEDTGTGFGAPAVSGITVAARSTSDFWVFYHTTPYTAKGKNYERIDAVHYSGGAVPAGSFGTPVSWEDAGASEAGSYALGENALADSSSYVHSFFENGSGTAYSKSISNADSAGSRTTISTGVMAWATEQDAVESHIGRACLYTDSGEKIIVPYLRDLATDAITTSQASAGTTSPSWSTQADASDAAPHFASANGLAEKAASAVANENDTNHYAVWIDSSTRDVFYATKTVGGSTWGTPTDFNNVTADDLWVRVIDRGGYYQLAIVYQDTSVLYYDEVQLSSSSSGLSATANQASETDSAQAVGRAKAKAAGQPSETDSAQAVTRGKTVAVGQASEADSVQAVTAAKTVTLGQPAETDSALPLVAAQIVEVGQPSETDSAQAFGAAKAKAVGQPSETDAAQQVTAAKAAAAGQPSETDSAQPVGKAKTVTVGQPAEADAALTVTALKATSVGQPSETDSVQSVSVAKAATANRTDETDTAQPVGKAKATTTGQPSETDTAQPVAAAKTVAATQPSETDTALAVTVVKTVTVNRASETDTALAVSATAQTIVELGQPSETDLSQPVYATKTVAAGQTSETDTAQPVTAIKTVTVGQPAEADAALATGSAKTTATTQPSETDTAQPVTAVKALAVGQPSETDTVPATVTAIKRQTLGQPSETDAAQAVTAALSSITVALNQATETDRAWAIRAHSYRQASSATYAPSATATYAPSATATYGPATSATYGPAGGTATYNNEGEEAL